MTYSPGFLDQERLPGFLGYSAELRGLTAKCLCVDAEKRGTARELLQLVEGATMFLNKRGKLPSTVKLFDGEVSWSDK
jgi:hypothetical protein